MVAHVIIRHRNGDDRIACGGRIEKAPEGVTLVACAICAMARVILTSPKN